jgi:hypothetical protein
MICQGCCTWNEDHRLVHGVKATGYFLGSSLLAIGTMAVVIAVVALFFASIALFGLYIYIGTFKPLTLLYLIPLGFLSSCCKVIAVGSCAIRILEALPAVRELLDAGIEKSKYHFVKTFI